MICSAGLNANAQWKKTTLTGNKDLFDLHFNQGHLLIGGFNSALYSSNDSGKTLKALSLNIPQNIRGVWVFHPDTLLIIGENARVQKSYDGGKTWSQKYVRTAAYAYDIAFQKQFGVAVGKDFMALSSNNLGETWSVDTTLAIGKKINAVSIMPNGQCWAAADSCFILNKHIQSKKWRIIKLNNTVNLSCIQSFGDSIILVAGSVTDTLQPNNIRNAIFKSTDSGNHFFETTATEMRSITGLFFSSPDSGFFCGSNGLILKCNNPMDQQFRGIQLSGTASTYNSIFTIGGKGIAIGDGGLVSRTNNYGGYGLDLPHQIKASIDVYPNPCNGSFCFSDNIDPNNIKIYNALGQSISFELSNKLCKINETAAGLYWIILKQGDQTRLLKVHID